mmetsp:Transcript_56916/g.151940  ORF Transcript_56916/g.151940 Transcript_56916/m.151940 type:complete len:261 (+) Transcript_56916:755-1537(+)
MTMSPCAASRSPNSPSSVRRSIKGRRGFSARAMAVMTIFVTASQPTLGCFASCCTSLSEHTANFTSFVLDERSKRIGNVFARPMLTSRPERRGASCTTTVAIRSTAVRKTRRWAPTGLASACCTALQMQSKASSGFAAYGRRDASTGEHAAFPKARRAWSTADSSAGPAKRKPSSSSALHPAQHTRLSGTSQEAKAVDLDATVTASGTASLIVGTFSNFRTWAMDFAGTSSGNASHHAFLASICSASSPKECTWVLQLSA